MIEQNSIPFLHPESCVEHGFVYCGAWHDGGIPAHYLLYKDARYLVIQSCCGRQNADHQLAIPRAALPWLTHLVRCPFTQSEGYKKCFDGESLTVCRSATLNGEGIAGFQIQSMSCRIGVKPASARRILITDFFMHEYLVLWMDGLSSGS